MNNNKIVPLTILCSLLISSSVLAMKYSKLQKQEPLNRRRKQEFFREKIDDGIAFLKEIQLFNSEVQFSESPSPSPSPRSQYFEENEDVFSQNYTHRRRKKKRKKRATKAAQLKAVSFYATQREQ